MKKTLELTDKEALGIYPNAPQELKTILELNWGKSFFYKKITDRINNYEDACADQGIKPLTIDDFSFIAAQYRERAFKNYQQIVIADSLNEGWIPNWNDHSQRKYYPWFEHKEAGLGFSFTSYVNWNAHTAVGSRLYFKDEATAICFGKICIKESLI